jgi:hypothetical protein
MKLTIRLHLVPRLKMHGVTPQLSHTASWRGTRLRTGTTLPYKRVYPKVSGLSHNEINNDNFKHSFRRNTKGYGGKTHYTDSQNSDTTTPGGRELYHLQFSLQAASPETF